MQVHYLMLSKGLTTAGGASVKHWLGPVAWKRQPAHRIRVTKAMVHDHQTTRVSSMKKFLLSSVALLGPRSCSAFVSAGFPKLRDATRLNDSAPVVAHRRR